MFTQKLHIFQKTFENMCVAIFHALWKLFFVICTIFCMRLIEITIRWVHSHRRVNRQIHHIFPNYHTHGILSNLPLVYIVSNIEVIRTIYRVCDNLGKYDVFGGLCDPLYMRRSHFYHTKLLTKVSDVRKVSATTIGYSNYKLSLKHRNLAEPVKIDVIFNQQPILDFDVNGLIFTVPQLTVAVNPVFSRFTIDWKSVVCSCKLKQFNVIRRDVIEDRILKMTSRGWICLDSS